MPGPKTPKSPSEGGLVQIGGAPSIQEARPDSPRALGSRTTTGSICPVRWMPPPAAPPRIWRALVGCCTVISECLCVVKDKIGSQIEKFPIHFLRRHVRHCGAGAAVRRSAARGTGHL